MSRISVNNLKSSRESIFDYFNQSVNIKETLLLILFEKSVLNFLLRLINAFPLSAKTYMPLKSTNWSDLFQFYNTFSFSQKRLVISVFILIIDQIDQKPISHTSVYTGEVSVLAFCITTFVFRIEIFMSLSMSLSL